MAKGQWSTLDATQRDYVQVSSKSKSDREKPRAAAMKRRADLKQEELRQKRDIPDNYGDIYEYSRNNILT